MSATIRSCPGYCCAAFMLRIDHEAAVEKDWSKVEDGEALVDMLIPLPSAIGVERLRAAGSPLADRGLLADHAYTCRHWDESTRLCGIYAERPAMCRRYPGDADDGSGECEHGCGLVVTAS